MIHPWHPGGSLITPFMGLRVLSSRPTLNLRRIGCVPTRQLISPPPSLSAIAFIRLPFLSTSLGALAGLLGPPP